jgi:hypothetical protein
MDAHDSCLCLSFDHLFNCLTPMFSEFCSNFALVSFYLKFMLVKSHWRIRDRCQWIASFFSDHKCISRLAVMPIKVWRLCILLMRANFQIAIFELFICYRVYHPFRLAKICQWWFDFRHFPSSLKKWSLPKK